MLGQSPAGWGQQDPNQWGGGGGYYGGYGQGYDQYGYPTQASHDAGAYGYGSYSGYGNYSHQVSSDIRAVLCASGFYFLTIKRTPGLLQRSQLYHHALGCFRDCVN